MLYNLHKADLQDAYEILILCYRTGRKLVGAAAAASAKAARKRARLSAEPQIVKPSSTQHLSADLMLPDYHVLDQVLLDTY